MAHVGNGTEIETGSDSWKTANRGHLPCPKLLSEGLIFMTTL